MKISIIVPVLNEKSILVAGLTSLQNSLKYLQKENIGQWEVIISDSGSTDGTFEILRSLPFRPNWVITRNEFEDPSVGQAIKHGISVASGDSYFIFPIDGILSKDGFKELWFALQSGFLCGGFYKRYIPTTPILRVYGYIQNKIRLKTFKHLVWTNGIFMRKDILQNFNFPTMGFLEDVYLSDYLRKQSRWIVLPGPFLVSSRRYYPNNIFKRIFTNFIIMCLFRLKLSDPVSLKRMYNT